MKRVLVVDDNPRNNSVYTDPLKKVYNIQVVMALSSVVRIMKHKSFDIMVLDVMMPTQNTESPSELTTGLYFFRESIKNQFPNLKVLFWSNRSKDSFDKFFTDGIPENVSFLHKDRNNHLQLLETIKRIIGQ